MARLIKKTAHGPEIVDCGGEKKKICRCGLSDNQPWCDGSHSKTDEEDPAKMYIYKHGVRQEIVDPFKESKDKT